MEKKVKIEAFVVDSIADISNIHIGDIKQQCPYLKDLFSQVLVRSKIH